MTEPASAFTLRPLAAEDVPALHLLSVEVGWPHRPDDWRFAIGLGAGLVACDAARRIGGCAMWWPDGPEAGHVGMVIVSPRLQGRGLGRRLMAAILAAAGERGLELNATPAGRPLYERDGFVAAGAVRQHQGLAIVPAADGAEAPPGSVRSLAEGDIAALRIVDRQATGRDRTRLLDTLLGIASAVVVHEVEGRVAGFAVTRPFGRGHVVGPLVAGSDDAAIALFRPSIAAHQGAFLRTDMLLDDGAFPRFVEQAGLARVDVAITMARGVRDVAAPGPARLYCITSQALG